MNTLRRYAGFISIGKESLSANITRFFIFRTFIKRAYIPVIAVYATTVGDVSITQLGIIAAAGSAVSLLAQVPGGYISDTYGHKRAIVFGMMLSALSPLFYVFIPNFWGILFGAVFFFGSTPIFLGTLPAFMYDTLASLGREREASKVFGRSQSVGLLANVVLIILVPLTYSITPVLPFLIGFVLMMVNVIASLGLVTPPVAKRLKESERGSKFVAFTKIFSGLVDRRHVLLFFVLGLATGLGRGLQEFREIVLQDVGLSVGLFGVVIAMGSLIGAGLSFNFHHFDDVRPKRFFLLDTGIMIALSVLIGATTNLWVSVVGFVLVTAYVRTRRELIRAYLLKDAPLPHLKATYLSLFEVFGALNGVWIPIALGFLMASYGSTRGILILALLLLPVALVVHFWAREGGIRKGGGSL